MGKTFCVIMLIMTLFLSGCNRENQEKPQNQERNNTMKTIVAVGDSLTAGQGVVEEKSYPARLEKKLQAAGYNYRVINAGVSAETSSGTLSRLDWILTMEPDIILLETGANDGLRGIDPQLLEDNLREILSTLRDKDVVVLLAGMKMVYNLGPVYVARFNEIYPKLADEFEVIFYPFFLEGVAMNHEYNQSDGIHPTAEGYRIITENIYPFVQKAIEKREGR